MPGVTPSRPRAARLANPVDLNAVRPRLVPIRNADGEHAVDKLGVAGDSLTLFTDGLIERRAPQEDPADQIRALLGQSAGSTADETAGRLRQLALGNGQRPDDDVAVIVLRRDSADSNGITPASSQGACVEVELSPSPSCPAEARAALSPIAAGLPTQVYQRPGASSTKSIWRATPVTSSTRLTRSNRSTPAMSNSPASRRRRLSVLGTVDLE